MYSLKLLMEEPVLLAYSNRFEYLLSFRLFHSNNLRRWFSVLDNSFVDSAVVPNRYITAHLECTFIVELI